MPTNALVARQTYSDPIASVHSSANFRRTNELENIVPPYSTHAYNIPKVPPDVPCHISVLSRTKCLSDTCNDGKIGSNQSDRPHQPVRPVVSTGQIGSPDHAISNQQIVSTSTQPNSSINLEKFFAECKNDLAKMIKENLE